MARLWSCGFELNSATTSVEVNTVAGGPTINSSIVHPGGGKFSGEINGLATGVRKTFDQQFLAAAAAGPFFGRTYFYFTAFPNVTTSIISWSDSTLTNLWVNITSAGALSLNDGGGQIGSSTTLNLNQWYRIETQFFWKTSTTSVAELLVDGSTIATASNRNLVGTIFSYNNGGNLRTETGTSGHWFMDDISVNDNTGSFQTTYSGAGTIIHLYPKSTGSVNTFDTQTGGSSGSSNNFSRVLEFPPDDATTFNGTATLNNEDLFLAQPVSSLGTVTLVSIGCRIRNSTADATAAIKYELKNFGTGTTSQGTAVVPNTTSWVTHSNPQPRIYKLTLYQDPDAVNWNIQTINNMQIGYKLTTAPGVAGQRIDATLVWALLEATQVSPASHRLASQNVGP